MKNVLFEESGAVERILCKLTEIGPKKFIILAVCAFFCFSILIFYMGYSANRQMEKTVTEQFNRQQLILAKKIAGDISYHFKFLETSLRELNQFREQNIDQRDEIVTHATSLSTLLADWLVLAVVQLDPEGKGPVIFSNEEPIGNKGLGFECDRYFLWGAKPENRDKIIIGRTFIPDIGPFQGRRLLVMATPTWIMNPFQNSNLGYHFEGISILVVDPASIAQRYT